MENIVNNHLKDIYGLNPNIPHLALQFPRLPPGLANPMFKIFENPMKDKFANENSLINKKLEGFQHSYQRHVAQLLTMNSNGVIPPSHPLFNPQNSLTIMSIENEKLTKENLELKKMLDKKDSSPRSNLS